MEKIRYEVDPFNRLVVSGGGKGKGLPKFRRVLDGTFKVDAQNSLSYHIASPAGFATDTPGRIKLKGAWRLTKDHDLSFSLEKDRGPGPSDDLTLSGSIIDVDANLVRFAMTTKTAGGERTYAIALTGSWRLDSCGRMTFVITREDGPRGILTFEGRWEVGSHNELVYRYERTRGRRKTGRLHALVFRGLWQVTGRYALSYLLDARSNSAFDFRAGLARCADDRIVFELGAGLAKRLRPAMRTITLYGTWRATGDSALSFEIESARNKLYSIAFGVEAHLAGKNTILCKLKSRADGRDLGLTVELSRALAKGSGRAFLRLAKDADETALTGGAGFGW